MVKALIILLASASFAFAQSVNSEMADLKLGKTYEVRVSVTGAGSDDGQVVIALFNNKKGFLKEAHKIRFSAIREGCSEAVFTDVPAGRYAVSVFHDENANDKLDKNILGIPKEDFGSSGPPRGFLSKPKWENSSFTLQAHKKVTISLD